jgi:hypothetical protein
MGYLAIKRIFEDNNIPFMKRIIINASDLKQKLETLNLNSANSTIVSIDAEDYYPSVHFKLVRKAAEFYSSSLSIDNPHVIRRCLDMIAFGMSLTLFTFQDVYYEYDGAEDPDDRGLSIGAFE